MSTRYPTAAHEWFDRVWNQKDINAVDDLLAPNAVIHGLDDGSGNAIRGAEAFRPMHAAFTSAFPDIHVRVVDYVAQGNKLAVRCEVTGTHHGDGLGIQATGKPFKITGMAFAVINQDGKMVEAWNEFNFHTMNVQLGIAE